MGLLFRSCYIMDMCIYLLYMFFHRPRYYQIDLIYFRSFLFLINCINYHLVDLMSELFVFEFY